jgi:tetratricopeptide (TPR) repeat protein
MFSPDSFRCSNYCHAASLMILALCLSRSPAHASDLEDCNSRIADKVQAGCTANIENPATPSGNDVKALVNRARMHANRAEFDPALADAEAALKLDPRSIPALLIRGYVQQRKNNIDQALADFEQAIEIDPKNPGPLISRANLRIQQRSWAEALKDFDPAIALRPDLSMAHAGRGRAYLEMGDLDQAMSALSEAIALNINTPNAFYMRGLVYRRKGELDHAIDDLTRAAVQAPPNDFGPYLIRGQLYSARGDYRRAIADFDKELSIVPGEKNALQLRQSTLALQAGIASSHDTPANSPPVAAVTRPPASPVAPAQAGSPAASSPKQSTDQAKQLVDQQRYADAVPLLSAWKNLPGAQPDRQGLARFRSGVDVQFHQRGRTGRPRRRPTDEG